MLELLQPQSPVAQGSKGEVTECSATATESGGKVVCLKVWTQHFNKNRSLWKADLKEGRSILGVAFESVARTLTSTLDIVINRSCRVEKWLHTHARAHAHTHMHTHTCTHTHTHNHDLLLTGAGDPRKRASTLESGRGNPIEANGPSGKPETSTEKLDPQSGTGKE